MKNNQKENENKKNATTFNNSIYNTNKISYYKNNSKETKISNEQKEKYVAVLKIGIVKELMQQGIITKDEMTIIIKQIKKQDKLEVDIE